jgi:CheY-like chemotaxis protein
MKKILIIEDDPKVLKTLLDLLLPQVYGEIFEPEWDITICTNEESAKLQYPSFYDFILLDHDLPDRGNGGRILNHWYAEFAKPIPARNTAEMTFVSGIDIIKNHTKIIAISCIAVNNERLVNLGANIAVEKMNPNFIEMLKKELKT